MINLTKWNVEDVEFWEREGKGLANRNLWISIPCLLCAFAVWLAWSIITVQMKNTGFPFEDVQLFTLSAVAGLTGATLRIPNSFFIAIAGGRNVIFLTTAFLIIPAVGTGIALRSPETPYSVFVVLAALSGFGGGNFASSMSNISFFFPKSQQGLALGLNAGIGNLGVSVMQVLLPAVMLVGVFGGPSLPLLSGAGEVFIQNCGFIWVPLLLVLVVAAWFGMNNLMTVSEFSSTAAALGKVTFLTLLGFVGAAVGLYMLLGLGITMWVVLPVTIALTVFLMKFLSPGPVKAGLEKQFTIFREKHNWIMTILYIMTFGSFIGYSAAFPLSIKVLFGVLPDGSPNPNAPNPFAYAWLGPLVGSLVRPVGGWASDKLGGARVTHWTTVSMTIAALGVAYYMKQAIGSATPEEYFIPFLVLFLILFTATGVGNGSTFRMVPIIFPPAQAGPVLGWISAVAAYGAFMIPRIFGQNIKAKTPEYALYGLAAYYFICLLLNWWYYARKNAEVKC